MLNNDWLISTTKISNKITLNFILIIELNLFKPLITRINIIKTCFNIIHLIIFM